MHCGMPEDLQRTRQVHTIGIMSYSLHAYDVLTVKVAITRPFHYQMDNSGRKNTGMGQLRSSYLHGVVFYDYKRSEERNGKKRD